MGMRIACAKGCGHMIEVTDEVLDEAMKHGGSINVAHEVCPTDPQAKMRRFKVTYTVEELIEGEAEPVMLAKVGGEVEAGSFKLALPKLQENLSMQWSRTVGLADIVDAEAIQTEGDTDADQGREAPEQS